MEDRSRSTIRLLGGVQIRSPSGEPLDRASQPRPAALLAALAASGERGISRERLVDLLWDEVDDRTARRHLSNAAYAVRQDLGADAIRTTGDQVYLNAEGVWTDVAAFETALERGALEEAASLYQGEFLEGFYLKGAGSFERWVTDERNRLSHSYAEVLESLAVAAEGKSQHLQAASWWQRLLAHDPWNTRVVLRLMAALTTAGDRPNAIQNGEAHVRRLAEELELDPDPTVVEAIEKLRAGGSISVPGQVAEPVAQIAAGHSEPQGATQALKVQEKRPKSSHVLMASALALAVIAVAVALRFAREEERLTVLPSGSTIAVIPLAPASPDSQLSRLGRELVTTLSMNLDNLGEVRAISAQAILKTLDDPTGIYTEDEGAAVARALGAASFLHGALVRRGSEAHATVVLYATDEKRSELARASATASPDDVTVFADSLTLQLVREIWRSRHPPTPNLAAITTSSPRALRYFLDGEAAFVETQWDVAEDAYARAFREDSTFWLASLMYSYVVSVWTLPPDRDSLVLAGFHDDIAKLPQPYARMVDVAGRYVGLKDYLYTDSSWSSDLVAYRELADQYPDYWFLAFDYADDMSHWGPLYGYSAIEVLSAWNMLFHVNPELETGQLEEGWVHALLMSLGRNRQFTNRGLTSLGRIRGWSEVPARWRLALKALDGELDTSLADTAAQELRVAVSREPTRPTRPHWRFLFENAMAGMPQVQIEVSRRVLNYGVAPEVAFWHRLGMAFAWATRGAWDSALATADSLVKHAPPGWEWVEDHRYRLAAVGASLGLLRTEDVAERTPDPTRTRASHWCRPRCNWQGETAWLDGVIAFGQNDSVSLTRAQESLIQAGDTSDYRAITLGAFQLALEGDQGRAGDIIARLELDRRVGERLLSFEAGPFAIGVNRLAASKWLLTAGDTARAAKLLQWHVRDPIAWDYAASNGVLASLAIRQQAMIAEAQGQHDLAIEYYRQFLRRYDMPPEQHRHWADDARAALKRLEAELP